MEFMELNHRNPSRHRLEEHDILNWIKHNRKVMNKGEMKGERVEKFKVLRGRLRSINSRTNMSSAEGKKDEATASGGRLVFVRSGRL